MAAVGPQIGDLKLFGMHFNQMILLEHLIRSGNQMEPIHANLRVVRRNPTPYEEAMRNPEGSDPPPIDFYVDDDDMITEPSSGLSLYPSEEAFPLKFDLDPRKLWNLNWGTPFPVEMKIQYKPPNHYGIIPRGGVRPATFKEMLKCLPWVKRYSAFEAEERKKQLTQQRAQRLFLKRK